MGGNISSFLGMCEVDNGLQDNEGSGMSLELTDLGGFLSKYIFVMLDKDRQNRISKSEYLALVNHFRAEKTTEEELDLFLKRHVPEGQSTDYISESLFRRLIIQLATDFEEHVSDRMKYLMALFDKDNDGFVSEEDLRNVYGAIGIEVPIEPIVSLIQKYDVDGDNKLSTEEFEQLGRSSLSKLFVNRMVKSTEDKLVEDAIRRGSFVSRALCAIGAGESGIAKTSVNNNKAITQLPLPLCNSASYTIVGKAGQKVKEPAILVGDCCASSKSLFNDSSLGLDTSGNSLTKAASGRSGSGEGFQERLGTLLHYMTDLQVPIHGDEQGDKK